MASNQLLHAMACAYPRQHQMAAATSTMPDCGCPCTRCLAPAALPLRCRQTGPLRRCWLS
jgi:hypothetical protein